jgi:hypothetical protein
MRAGIVLDDWKLPVFRKRLPEAGFAYTDGGALGESLTLLIVDTDNMIGLAETIKKCQIECSKQEPKA